MTTKSVVCESYDFQIENHHIILSRSHLRPAVTHRIVSSHHSAKTKTRAKFSTLFLFVGFLFLSYLLRHMIFCVSTISMWMRALSLYARQKLTRVWGFRMPDELSPVFRSNSFPNNRKERNLDVFDLLTGIENKNMNQQGKGDKKTNKKFNDYFISRKASNVFVERSK